MKRILSIGLSAALLAGYSIAPAVPAEQAGAAVEGRTSTKQRGIVTIVPDAALSEGSLILKIVAFNRTAEPASFSSDNIRTFTAAGKAVGLLSLERLIEQVSAAARASAARSMNDAYQSSSHSRPGMPRTSTGELDVSGHAGANESFDREISMRAGPAAPSEGLDEQSQEQIAALKAGILQPQTIAPGSAAGGQIVTEKLKFSRKQERALRVVVDFNGEQHELKLAVPSAR